MTRGRTIALVIFAIVVATVVVAGPVRVWDALTLRTVEEYWPNGQMRCRYEVRLWESQDSVPWVNEEGSDPPGVGSR